MLILGTEICHLGLFANEGLLSFFVFYEAALIPLIILISRFGSGNQRLRSTIVFCIFTIAGAMPMLCATLYLIQFTENLVIAGGVNMFISFHTFHSETIIL
jgi:NADH:ubiquinone oxidoreductase subunit 4 (subunit M)